MDFVRFFRNFCARFDKIYRIMYPGHVIIHIITGENLKKANRGKHRDAKLWGLKRLKAKRLIDRHFGPATCFLSILKK